MHGHCANAAGAVLASTAPLCPACVVAPANADTLRALEWEVYVRVTDVEARRRPSSQNTHENRIPAAWQRDRVATNYEFIVPLPALADHVNVSVLLRARIPGGAFFVVAEWKGRYETAELTQMQMLRLERSVRDMRAPTGVGEDCIAFSFAPSALVGTPSLHVTACQAAVCGATATAAAGSAQWQSDLDAD
jgi:hypothetical protein